jgi:cytidine deaminase
MKVSEDIKKIWKAAVRARSRAYAPYSKFKVGAAFASGGDMISGCNVENASYGATLCAERVAIFKAISEGKKLGENIVIVTDAKLPAPPCGLCLQVMSEFCGARTRIWMGSPKKIFASKLFSELLTTPFQKKALRAS